MRRYVEIALTGWFLIGLIPGSLFAYLSVAVTDRGELCELPADYYQADAEWLRCCEQLQSEGLKDAAGWEIPI
jgi:hypothetical protein